jgi:hypothetical protein
MAMSPLKLSPRRLPINTSLADDAETVQPSLQHYCVPLSGCKTDAYMATVAAATAAKAVLSSSASSAGPFR